MKFEELFGNAKWVTCDGSCISPYIRAEFDAPCKDASIVVCGLGFSELYINGNRVGDELFTPLNSCYHENPEMLCYKDGERLGSRTYAVKKDIGEYLIEGKNALCIHVGPGWYAHGELNKEVDPWVKPYGKVKAAWRIKFADGSEFVSDESAVWAQSPIVNYNIIHGEEQSDRFYIPDASEVNCSFNEWKLVQITDMPETEYYLSDCPADKVIRAIAPSKLSECDGKAVYDVGENISGRVVFTVDSPCSVSLRHSEWLDENGIPDIEHGFWQNSKFDCLGGREYNLVFTWAGFRYFEIDAEAKVLRVEVIHADVEPTSAFESSSEQLNWYHAAFIRTQLNNMHTGIPSDCPQAERRGYTGDGQHVCEAAFTAIDCEKFYRKWMKDIIDCQDKISGHVQHTAPYVPSGGGPGGWGCAIIEVPYQFWKYYGDIEPLKEMYPHAKKYFEYLDSVSTDGIMYVNEEDRMGWLGEWAIPIGWQERMNVLLPPPYPTLYFYIRSLGRAIEAAKLIGATRDIPQFEAKKAHFTDVIIKNYYNPETGDFADNTFFANCFALDLGLGDERTWNNLVAAVQEKKCFYTGIFGTDITLKLLFERGRGDLAYMLMNADGENTFGKWRKAGLTTLAEHWDMARSLDHPMFGAADKHLFKQILGIKQTEGSVAFENVKIAPADIPELTEASGYITTPIGKISVRYERADGHIGFVVEVPNGGEFEFDGMTMPLKPGRNIILQ